MPKSMTAFARQDAEFDWGSLTWEIRSVNNRYLDAHFHLPEQLRMLEAPIRERVARQVRRGKLNCSLKLRMDGQAAGRLSVNEPLMQAVMDACRTIEDDMINPARISAMDVLQWPGVAEEPRPDTDAIRQDALALLDDALGELVDARATEGARLKAFILQRLDEE